jgi:enamine deaminase RidA (YjgF/YER057c/UK114 family)
MVFCSGQIPIDPATGNFVSEDISEQTEQVSEEPGRGPCICRQLASIE